MLLSALLAALAAAVVAGGSASRTRLEVVLPRPAALLPAAAPRHRLNRAAWVLAGLATWWLMGGMVGAASAVVVVLLGPRILERLSPAPDDSREVAAQLPLVLDLLAACLAGGATPLLAVTAVSAAFPGACALRLQRVAAAMAVGSPPEEAWRALGEDRGPAGRAARALARAAEGGAPVAVAVQRVAEDARRDAGARGDRAARRAGVLAVVPLGLCFLPAFVLLGVVPTLLGLTGPLLSSL